MYRNLPSWISAAKPTLHAVDTSRSMNEQGSKKRRMITFRTNGPAVRPKCSDCNLDQSLEFSPAQPWVMGDRWIPIFGGNLACLSIRRITANHRIVQEPFTVLCQGNR